MIYRIVAGFYRIMTHLYDKRLQPGFSALPIVRFIPASSIVNEAAKNNILAGQFHRLAKIITDPENFRMHMARIVKDLLGRHYKLKMLLGKYRALLAANSAALGPYRRPISWFLEYIGQ